MGHRLLQPQRHGARPPGGRGDGPHRGRLPGASPLLAWPALIPWSIFVPVIVLAGLFLPPRWLAVSTLVTTVLLGAYDGWALKGEHGDYLAPWS